MNQNIFTKWLYTTNKFIKKDSNDKPTHLLLNGGCLHIKQEDFQYFMDLYSKCIKNKESLFVVECRPELFPLFFDLDYLLSENKNNEIENDTYKEIIKIIKNTISFFYNKKFKCIVSSTDNKLVTKNDIKYIKKGFHIHFPDLIVDKEIALMIRKSCIIKLKTIYSDVFFSNTFKDIIDEHVFNANGLRLTGSKKGHFVNNRQSFVNEERPYYPEYVLNETNDIDIEDIDKMNNNYNYMINQTSIIVYDKNKEKVINIPEGLKEDTSDNECEECESVSNNWIKIFKTTNEYTEIIRFFKTYVKDYSSDDIKRIFTSESKNVYILWSKSKYCQNIGRNHNSCGIFFKLTMDGLSQKCFCKCDTMEGRKYGYCKDFASTLIPCTSHLQKLLGWKDTVSLSVNLSKDCTIPDFRDILYNSFTNKTPLKSKKTVKPKK